MSDENPTPTLYAEGAGSQVWHGDCIEVMALLPAASFDAVITDPPYALEFMGRAWDRFEPLEFERWCESWARQAYRILKPGGHLLAFGSTRTAHRLTAGIEDAGFEIRDTITWLYSSGFPKNLDVSAAIDKQRHNRPEMLRFTAWCRAARDAAGISNRDIDDAFGFVGMAGHWTTDKSQPAVPTLEQIPTLLAVLRITIDDVPADVRELIVDLNGQKGQPGAAWFERPVTGMHEGSSAASEWRARYDGGNVARASERRDVAATDAAAKWQGWGTALAPASEPITVARKPLIGTVATNVLTHGTGALNVDATRIGGELRTNPPASNKPGGAALNMSVAGMPQDAEPTEAAGRWPKNVVLSHAPLLDPITGEIVGDGCAYGCVDGCPVRELDQQAPDTGAAAPASGPTRTGATAGTVAYGARRGTDQAPAYHGDRGGASRMFPVFRYEAKAPGKERPAVVDEQGNIVMHPTVKPLELMRWLVRLIVPRGGRIVEPFAGSGTTLEAAIVEGVACVAIELGAEHLPLIAERMNRQPAVVAERMDKGEHTAPDGALW